jgi:hypothetical protein
MQKEPFFQPNGLKRLIFTIIVLPIVYLIYSKTFWTLYDLAGATRYIPAVHSKAGD